ELSPGVLDASTDGYAAAAGIRHGGLGRQALGWLAQTRRPGRLRDGGTRYAGVRMRPDTAGESTGRESTGLNSRSVQTAWDSLAVHQQSPQRSWAVAAARDRRRNGRRLF